MKLNITQKLNRLAELMDDIATDREGFAPEKAPHLAALAEIQKREDETVAHLAIEAADLTAKIKTETVAAQQTTHGHSLMAVYAKGRVTWDGKGLDGYAVANPEVAAFRRVGEPSVSIREVKK